MTNLEKIRAMSVEELIGLVGHDSLCSYIQYEYPKECARRGVCDSCIKEWLLTEVEE
jgi:hypothetical protein